MRQLLILAVLFFIAGCHSSPSYQWSDKPLSDREKKALTAVMDVYRQNNISVLDEYGTERQVVGAQMGVMPSKCDMEHDRDMPAEHHEGHHAEHHQGHEGHEHHHDMEEGAQSEDHLATLLSKAMIEKKKEYSQPTVILEEEVYFYKTIYVATVDDKTLTLQKTAAREDADQRSAEPVEPSLLKEIAGAAGGAVTEDHIMLP
ncbi:MAG: hypothetical protein HY885_05480 [Deltaproteobacteria bacterium]|nr:hypothetical protein [Deltaproteobacteria bacterium]